MSNKTRKITTEYLRPNQVQTDYPFLSAAGLATMRYLKTGPPYFKLSRKVLYRRSDIEKWLTAHPVKTMDSMGVMS